MDAIFHTNSAAQEYIGRVSLHEVINTLRASALEFLSVTPGERALDAGCGLGEMARRIAALVGTSGSVTAVDVNPAMISAARRNHVAVPCAAGSSGRDWRTPCCGR
ncbi:ubiquinone/menaquinone biosynthesis C-methylase UbiE [Streptosporangium becharense]|uniref:Ubiquinone/menaquinone biosynthesis C-methylase UbiE n=2 Tax=Streptosporangium becharense TaxID=1816182 RepID=A0A7W9MIB5_9ACTN|nr:ubiquinone/menaquinone biosynthesis C-methylase UbiE [Streptosporangium becharense]MBB5821441.1 ubiquinone/menaquinone biosynthesis C-methylase UbiE [Streptosporangium becharense]